MAVRKKTTTRAKKTGVRKKKTTARRTTKAKTTTRRAAKPRAKKAKKTTKRKASGLTKMTYSLSAELQAIVGAKSLTRPEIVKKLWAYIKSRKCQDTKNRRMIVPDAKLAQVIGSRPVDMMKLAGMISKHIK
jgi:chromatin remodeling complex protein RSC6